MRKFLLVVWVLVLAVPLTVAQEDTGEDDLPWWNDRVWYEIFVRSFYDSTGDGIGDINGIIEKLDYLNDGDPTTTDDLGITGIWLMPINPSPSYHGYDVTNYRDINPDYGTIEDMQRLVEEADARGIAIIMDLVINHTGVDHPWFVASAEDPSSDTGDWYVWEEEDPGFRGPENQVVWHSNGDRYYYGVFWGGMPDLNYETPAVTDEIYDISRFWLEEVGVSGFRLDAIKHIVEDGDNQENTPATREWLANYHAFVESVNPEAVLVGEVWTSSILAAPYAGTSVDIVFEFDLAEAIIQSASFGIASSVENQMETVLEFYPEGQYGTFLTNHDQNRVASQMSGDIANLKTAASIYLTLPGAPFIYYGEEIGMTGTKPDPEIRTPMQWGDGAAPGVGFTVALPWESVNADWEDGITVSAQDEDPASLLNHYRSLIQLRNAVPALRQGDYVAVDGDAGSVFTFLRQTDEQTVLVIINMRDRERDNYGLTVAASDLGAVSGATVLYGADAEIAAPDVDENGGFSDYKPLDVIPPLGVVVIELES